MRIWFDTEFIEDGKTIDLISIGMVREDGKTLYAENADCNLNRASLWVIHNVLPHLQGKTAQYKPAEIAEMVREFAGEKPEFWANFDAYDWVALCQLFGTMMDLPKGWPMFCMDLQQWSVMLGSPDLPKQESAEHNALADAKWTKDAWHFLAARAEAR